MNEGIANAVFIDRRGHVVGHAFDFIASIAHRDTDSGRLEHIDVISSIAERHALRNIEAMMFHDADDPLLLIVAFA